MKNIGLKLNFAVCLVILLCLFISCKKEQSETSVIGYLRFNIEQGSSLKSTSAEKIASVVISIDKNDGTHVITSKKITLLYFNGVYLTEPLSIEVGSYKLTYFAVLDESDQVKYAAPLSGSSLAAYVTQPLSIDFTIQKDQVLTLIPEVLSTAGAVPGDFGLSNFKFTIVKTINIFPYAFIASSSNFSLTTATLTISDGTTDLSKVALAAQSNIIELPDKDNYIIKIQKTNYLTYYRSFTKANIESMVTPLIVMLQPEINGLVAYYPFEGNLNDASGNGKNGTYAGLSNFSIESFGTARNFINETSPYDYIRIPNSINPNAFSVCFYMNFDSSYGHHTMLYLSDGDSWTFSNFMMATTSGRISVIFDTLDLRTSDYSHDALIAQDFNATFLNSKSIVDNTNYYICCTFSGSTVSVYIDGVLDAEYNGVNRVHETVANTILIGACPKEFNPGVYYYPLNGKLDELRIYNRALSASEIKSLYNSYNIQ